MSEPLHLDDLEPDDDIDLPSLAKDLTRMTCFTAEKLAERDRAIEARVRAELAEDVRIVLSQRVTHAHMRPGIWDDGNVGDPKFGTGAGGTRCVECAARDRLTAFVAGSSRDTTPEANRG